jgi:hypothetical protein
VEEEEVVFNQVILQEDQEDQVVLDLLDIAVEQEILRQLVHHKEIMEVIMVAVDQ